MTTKLSAHFSLEELTYSDTAVRKGIDNSPSAAVIAALIRTAQGLETIRSLLIAPVRVSSGYRCKELNSLVGGQPDSQHLNGEAVDFTVPAFGTPEQVMRKLVGSTVAYDQIILEYNRWVHVSFSAFARRQALVYDASGKRAWQ